MELKIASLINFMSTWDSTLEVRQLETIWQTVDSAIEHGIEEAFLQAEESWKTSEFDWPVRSYILDMYAMWMNPNAASVLRAMYSHINNIPKMHHEKLFEKALEVVKEV